MKRSLHNPERVSELEGIEDLSATPCTIGVVARKQHGGKGEENEYIILKFFVGRMRGILSCKTRTFSKLLTSRC